MIKNNKDNNLLDLGIEQDTSVSNITWSDVQQKPAEFTPEYHLHSEYALRYHRHSINDLSDLDELKAILTHTHDERYYTKEQVDELLSSKANYSHTHSWYDIENRPIIGDDNSNNSGGGSDNNNGDNNSNNSSQERYIIKEIREPYFVEDEYGLYSAIVTHNLGTKRLEGKVTDLNFKELLVDIEPVDDNNVLITTDTKEKVYVLLKKLLI